MLLARRKFVKSGLFFAATTALFWDSARSVLAQTLKVGDQLPAEVLRDPVLSFTKETFEPYVGGYFEVPGARGKMLAMKLVKVEAFVPRPRTIVTDAFRLLFSADGELPIFSSIHPVKHGALGEFNLFLTRLGNGDREIYYEAVINHLS